MNIKRIIPLIAFLALSLLFWQGLKEDPNKLDSVLIDKPFPAFDSLSLSGKKITNKLFLGHLTLLNVWASWCVTCRAEHAVLMEIAKNKAILIYGLNYKDNKADAKRWLHQLGNPYQLVISDPKGMLAIDLGVYGVPETFLIDKQGIIRYKYVGSVSPEVWKNRLLPKVRELWQ